MGKALQDRLKETAYFKKSRAKKKKKDIDGDVQMEENDMQSPFVIPFPQKKEAKKKKAAKTAKAVIKANKKKKVKEEKTVIKLTSDGKVDKRCKAYKELVKELEKKAKKKNKK